MTGRLLEKIDLCFEQKYMKQPFPRPDDAMDTETTSEWAENTIDVT